MRESSATDYGEVEDEKVLLTLCDEARKGADERVDKVLGTGKKVFFTMMAEDRISKYQAGPQRGRQTDLEAAERC